MLIVMVCASKVWRFHMVGRFRDGAREFGLAMACSALFFAFMFAWLLWAAP